MVGLEAKLRCQGGDIERNIRNMSSISHLIPPGISIQFKAKMHTRTNSDLFDASL